MFLLDYLVVGYWTVLHHQDSKSGFFGSAGSIPALGTIGWLCQRQNTRNELAENFAQRNFEKRHHNDNLEPSHAYNTFERLIAVCPLSAISYKSKILHSQRSIAQQTILEAPQIRRQL
jgi:hypothetical protein